MKLREYLDKTGKLPVYHLEELLEELIEADKDKPSSRIIRTKKGQTAIAGLKMMEEKHNHSWYQELKERAYGHENELALFYRGNKITFSEMFEKADAIAQSLVEAGINKGDEIPACLSNTPELVYIMLAANKIGAKLNLFGASIDKEYLDEILSDSNQKLFIGTDDVYKEIQPTVEGKHFKKTILVSLADSLPLNPELTDEYEPSLDNYYHYENKAKEYQKQNPNIMTYAEFENFGRNTEKKVLDNNNLDTEFLITYTSGSTKVGRPKQIIHTNRSVITSGMFHDPELCGNPKIPGLRGLAHIHADSNTNIITCIADNLMQMWSVALEPEYGKDQALDYVFLNKPNYLNMSTSFVIQMAKDYLINKKYHENGTGRKLPFLLALFAVGEKTSKGEEKFINQFLRESRAGSGIKIMGLSLPFCTLSIGGGDCEHGGIYYTLWKSLQEKINGFRLKKGEYGMNQVPYAHISVFKQTANGLYEECKYNEYGIIAANSPTTMAGYKNDPEATKRLIIEDTVGREWVSSNVYGYIDNLGTVHVKGRAGDEIILNDGEIIHPSMIEDLVCSDTKNILSCSVVSAKTDDDVSIPVVNVEFQPKHRKQDMEILTSINQRIQTQYPEFAEETVYRIFTTDNSFPLTASGKRNIRALEELRLENTVKLDINNKNSKKESTEKVYRKK